MTIREDSRVIPPPPADDKSAPGGPAAANPAALTIEQAVRLLTAVGSKHATAETIRQHIQRGAPTTADGRINLVQYLAWLVREVSVGEE